MSKETIAAIDAAIEALRKKAWEEIAAEDVANDKYAGQTKAIIPAIYDYVESYGSIQVIVSDDVVFEINNTRFKEDEDDTVYIENSENNFDFSTVGIITEYAERANEVSKEDFDIIVEPDVVYDMGDDSSQEPISPEEDEIAISPEDYKDLSLTQLKEEKQEVLDELLQANKDAWKDLIKEIQTFINNFSPIIFSTHYYGDFIWDNSENINYGIYGDGDNQTIESVNTIWLNSLKEVL